MSYTIAMDLKGDVCAFLLQQIRAMGFPYERSADLMELATDFQMLKARVIAPKRRKVELADGLVVPLSLQLGFDAFALCAQAGRDLRPYQSRLLKKEDFRDLMLIDWGIQHFHMGTALEADGFMKRTDPLLFALVTDNHIHCVGFWSHGSWSDLEVVGIVHDNWPELIDKYRIHNIQGLSYTPTSADIGRLRNAQVNTAFEPRPGVFYFPPGGGQVLSGHSFIATQLALRLQRAVDVLTTKVKERIQELGGLTSSMTVSAYLGFNQLEARDQAGHLIAAQAV